MTFYVTLTNQYPHLLIGSFEAEHLALDAVKKLNAHFVESAGFFAIVDDASGADCAPNELLERATIPGLIANI